MCVDGASLVITKVGGEVKREGWFEVILVAYTQEKIVTAMKGKTVNMEVDLVEVGFQCLGIESGSRCGMDITDCIWPILRVELPIMSLRLSLNV